MKPHIYKRTGLWHCSGFRTVGLMVWGIGYSPRDAYLDWLQRND
jgi:hypothetical protein